METHYPVMETNHPLIETHYHLWEPFLKDKELSFVETIFEKQGMFEKKNSVFDALNSKILAYGHNFWYFAQNNSLMETHYHLWKPFFSPKWVSINGKLVYGKYKFVFISIADK